MDSESKNSSAQEAYKKIENVNSWLYLLAGTPDAVHTCKRKTQHASNWFLYVEDALINRVQLRALRNDSSIKDKLKTILSIAACRGRDRMDVDSMLEISAKPVRDVVSKCNFITQTIIPEVYRVYDCKKKGVIGPPTAVCHAEHGCLLIADVTGSFYKARLHYPVDVSELENGLSIPLGIAYNDGVAYISESGNGKIRVVDILGKSIYNPNLMTVKDLKSVLKNLGVQFVASSTNNSTGQVVDERWSAVQ